jgi:predicted phosphoribosyltransferase
LGARKYLIPPVSIHIRQQEKEKRKRRERKRESTSVSDVILNDEGHVTGDE